MEPWFEVIAQIIRQHQDLRVHRRYTTTDDDEYRAAPPYHGHTYSREFGFGDAFAGIALGAAF